MPCNHNCRQGRDCTCRRPTACGPDPVMLHVLSTTADAGARFRLTDEAITLSRECEAHLSTLGAIAQRAVLLRRMRRWREALAA